MQTKAKYKIKQSTERIVAVSVFTEETTLGAICANSLT